jgi:hypothetical protein
MITSPAGNILRELPCDVSLKDYENDDAFFIRSANGGDICYLPAGNQPGEEITKTIDASAYFNDPVQCIKILKTGTTATGIYVGWGV